MKKLFQPSQLMIIYWENEDVCTASTNTDGETDLPDMYGDRF